MSASESDMITTTPSLSVLSGVVRPSDYSRWVPGGDGDDSDNDDDESFYGLDSPPASTESSSVEFYEATETQ